MAAAVRGSNLMRNTIVLTMLALSAFRLGASEYFASPSGSPSGVGSRNDPWDLQTALNQFAVKPGDTVWLRGGVYSGTFTSSLAGAAGQPVVVRNYPGEWAVIDREGPGLFPTTFQIDGSWVWYWGFEITNSDPGRYIAASGSNPNEGRAQAITINSATNVKLINLVVHDSGNGIVDNNGGTDNEIYGCLIYHNGWSAPDRPHGDGIYAQNRTGSKRIADNILFSGFNEGINVYGSDQAALNNFEIEGNILFNSGILGHWFERNMLVGGYGACEHPVIAQNYSYFSKVDAYGPGQPLNLGYAAGCNDAEVRDNYLASTTNLIANKNLKLSGNTFAGLVQFAGGNTPSEDLKAYPGNLNIPYGTRPSGVYTYVRPNQYEIGRAHIAVFNWDGWPAIDVDLSKVLNAGDAFEIRDVQNFFGRPLVTGTYAGGSVTVPVASSVSSTPVGMPVHRVHTTGEFGAFVVLPAGAAPVRTGFPARKQPQSRFQ